MSSRAARIRAAATPIAVALLLFPVAFLALAALAGPWPAGRVLPETLTLARVRALIAGDSALRASLPLSLGISLGVAVFSTALGFVTSNHLVRARRRALWLWLAYLPFAISPVVLATCLLFVYVRLGLSGTALGVLLAQTTVAYAFATVFLVGMWNEEKRNLESVARTLGATRAQVWSRVWLPACLPMLRVCFFQTFLVSWAQYGLTLAIGAGKVRTLPLRVYDYLLEADPAYAALAALLLIAPPCALLWIERRVLLKAL